MRTVLVLLITVAVLAGFGCKRQAEPQEANVNDPALYAGPSLTVINADPAIVGDQTSISRQRQKQLEASGLWKPPAQPSQPQQQPQPAPDASAAATEAEAPQPPQEQAEEAAQPADQPRIDPATGEPVKSPSAGGSARGITGVVKKANQRSQETDERINEGE